MVVTSEVLIGERLDTSALELLRLRLLTYLLSDACGIDDCIAWL